MTNNSPSRHRPGRSGLFAATLVVTGVALAGCSDDTPDNWAAGISSSANAADAAAATTTTTTYTHPPYVPKPEDFALEVQVLEQQCFGSAGCNVTFRLGVSYGGDTIYAGEGPYTVVYTVAGTEDPFVGRFTLTPPTELTLTEEYVSTPPGATLAATVTQVF